MAGINQTFDLPLLADARSSGHTFTCTLPFPPSVNSLFGGGSAQKRFPSKKYKEWRAACPRLEPIGISAPCVVRYMFWLPDNRKRDLSNYLKAPEDYLVSQGVLADDNHQIVVAVFLAAGGIDKNNPRVDIDILNYHIPAATRWGCHPANRG